MMQISLLMTDITCSFFWNFLKNIWQLVGRRKAQVYKKNFFSDAWILSSLKLTARTPTNHWGWFRCNFLLGFGLFSGAFALDFRKGRPFLTQNSSESHSCSCKNFALGSIQAEFLYCQYHFNNVKMNLSCLILAVGLTVSPNHPQTMKIKWVGSRQHKWIQSCMHIKYYHILYIYPKMIHLCFPYDFLGALIFRPISTTPGRCCYWRGATDATCTATCHGGQKWAKGVLVRDALSENVNVDFLFQPKWSTNLWNTVYFQHFLFGDQIGSGYQTTQSISYLEVW